MMKEYRSNINTDLFFWGIFGLIITVILIYKQTGINQILITNLVMILIAYLSIKTQSHNFYLYQDRIEIINNLKLSDSHEIFSYDSIKEIGIRHNRRIPVLEIYLQDDGYRKFPFTGIDKQKRAEILENLTAYKLTALEYL